MMGHYLKRWKAESGFGTLEIAIILSLLSALAFVLTVMPEENEQVNREQEREYLRIADEQLINFIGLNGRLPCPDSDADGSEDCGVSKGTLPYITLGLKEPGYRSGDVALRYGVYRKSQSGTATGQATASAGDADLAVTKNRYEPLDANGDIQAVDNLNTLDFCVALTNGASAAFSTSQTYIQENSATRYAVAYAIATPGAQDADNVNGIFDGLNGGSGQGFNAASQPVNSASYDDHVLSRGFTELYKIMQCDVSIASLNIMANAVLVQDEVQSEAESLAEDTVKGTALAAVGIALNAANAVIAGVDLANASATLATSSGLLASAVASCAVLVGCALIPVYTAAVASATTGVVLSGVALGFSVAAVVAQAVATGMYADASIRAQSAAGSLGTVDWDSRIQARQADLVTAQAELATAQATQTALQNQLNSALATYNTNRNSLTNYAAAHDDPDFTGTPDVTTKTESMYAGIRNTFNLNNTYNAEQKTYKELQQRCDACPSPNVDTVVPAEGDYPAYTIYACEVSAAGTAKICDDAAAQKVISDTAYTNALNSFNTLANLRDTAMTAALNYQYYLGTDGDGNKTYASCQSFGCPLPRWLDNTWPTIIGIPIYNNFNMNQHYYSIYLLKKQEYDLAVQETATKQDVVNALIMSINAMQCSKEGKTYRETSQGSGIFECIPSTPIVGSTAESFAQGAREILDSADQQGVSE